MASITLAGILKNSIGEVDVGAIVTFTHLTTTGQTIKGTSNNLIVPPNGAYSINVEYGQVRIDYTTRFTERFVAIVLVNSDSTATNLPDLLLSADIPTNPQIAQFQAYLADTVVAKDAAVVAKNAAEAALAAIPTYGTAATEDVTTSTTDQTIGRVIKQGDTASLLAANISGNVVIGSTASTKKLDVGSTDSLSQINANRNISLSSNAGAGGISFSGGNLADPNANIEYARIKGFTDNVGTGTESGQLVWYTKAAGGAVTERMRIDAAGNTAFGNSSPNISASTLALTVGSATTLETSVEVQGNRTANGDFSALRFYNQTNEGAFIVARREGANNTVDLVFGTSNAGTLAERVRIDASGNALIGKSILSATTVGHELRASGLSLHTADSSEAVSLTRLGSDGVIINFKKVGAVVGSISITSSVTSFNTSSDERLKENISDSETASNEIDAIKIRQFDWIADGSHQKYGVVTQELISVAPYAVHVPEDPEEMQAVDYSKLVPMMIKELQELRARVAQLEL